MCYELVPLQRELIPALCNLEKLCFAVPWSEAMFSGELENRYATYRLVLFQGEPVAYMGLWQVADEGHITNIAVHPDHRRKGLAQMLLARFRQLAEEKGLCLLTLEVRESNAPAISLYQKCGFVPVGKRPKYYEGKEDALLLSLFLDEAAKGENPI